MVIHMQNIKRTGKQAVLQQNIAGEMEYLTFPAIEKTGLVGHLFSTRLGGVSKGELSTMNLSYSRGDEPANVDENFKRILSVMNRTPEDIVCTDQTHTANVRVATRKDAGKGVLYPRDYTDVDGLITNEPGIVLAAFYADCVPIYLVDTKHAAIGLLHSGWRGTAGKISAEAIRQMGIEYGSRPEDIVAAIGPSICGDCYEIGPDVAEQMRAAFPERQLEDCGVLRQGKGDRFQLDLWRMNVEILKEAGVKEEQISVTDLCTCCNKDYLFSHRGSHGKRGNLGAFMTLYTEEERNLRKA